MGAAKADHAGDAPVETAKSGGKRKIMLIVGCALLMSVIAAGLWFSGFLPVGRSGLNHVKERSVAARPVFVDVPSIVTNLDNGSRRDVFIKLKARIEVANKADQAAVTANMPNVLDAVQTYLRSMRPEEIQGGEGTYRLREALMNRIDIIAAPVTVINVLFIEMLIQ